jgi:hypothetical protein
MESYDLIPDKDLPKEVMLIERKKFLSGPLGVKSLAEGEYAYPASEIKKSGDTIEFGKAILITVEVEEEPSPEESRRKVLNEKKLACNKNQRVENIRLFNTDIVKISTKFAENDILYDLVWSAGSFYFVASGQPFNIVEELSKTTIQKLLQARA